jgi:Fe-S-cluster-containing hydrogenase component 2
MRESLRTLAGRLTDLDLDTAWSAAARGDFETAAVRLDRMKGKGEVPVLCRHCQERHSGAAYCRRFALRRP